MELNLKYYTGNDLYSDGKIEDKIIKYIKQNPEDYEKVLTKDSSWPVFYHLSNMRKNVINWYLFKKDSAILELGAGMGALTSTLCEKCKSVTSIELSKKRATAILERNKDKKNLEIMVGNFKDIKINKKFDYILLCGVLEYATLYMDSDSPYIDLLNKLKKMLNPNGKILIATENRLGIKYLCGANEDHSDIPFDGLNGYPSNSNNKSLSKAELDSLIKETDMECNYYYMFPDYKLPQLILTDEGLKKVKDYSYIPYYNKQMELVINERKLFEDIKNNNSIPIFANSYFLELSNKKEKKEIEFVKFNFYRKDKYQLNTYLINDKFYKVANSKEASYQIDSLIKIEKLLNENNIDHLDNYIEKDRVYTKYSNLSTLEKLLDENLKNNNIDEIEKIYDSLFKYYKKILGKEIKPDKTIFDKYNVKITKKEKDQLHFYKHGFIDVIPSNILVDKDKYILFDQEWYEENVPIEYLMYRAIINFFCNYMYGGEIKDCIINKYGINEMLFEELDSYFLKDKFNDEYEKYLTFSNNSEIINLSLLKSNYQDLYNEFEKLNTHYNNLSKDYKNVVQRNEELKALNNELHLHLENIYNSKRYKVIEKLANIKSKLTKK